MTDENLDILLNMVGHPWFTKETIAKEQGIIGQEIKMYDDSPDWRLLTALFRCLYKSHPIRDDIAGTTQSIAELTPELLYACTDAFYRPGNMVLSVAGNITLDQAVEACRRNGVYDAVEPPQVETIFPQEADTVQHKETTFTMPVNKPCFALGYKEAAFNWVKQNRNGTGIFMGLGNWTRSNSEICLLATKGKPKRISGSVRSVVLSPLQQHSRKPAEIRDRIVELMGDLPRIELFAREAAPGWDVWGNEAPTPEVKDVPADSVELVGKEETHEPDNQRDPAPQL